MEKRNLKIPIKRIFKGIVEKSFFLEQIFIFLYKVLGRRPWSLGYSIYKNREIIDTIENELAVFNGEKLPPNYGFGIDERIVEYPWFFSRLKKSEKVLLDAGAVLNHAGILGLSHLKNRDLSILTLHSEGEYKVPISPTYIYEDLRNTSFKDGFFDTIVCLSTLEHVGMDNTYLYTPDHAKNENDKYAFLQAVKELKRILKKGGSLCISVPYGRNKNHKWFQIFDSEMIIRLKEAFDPVMVNEKYFKYDDNQWNYASQESCEDGYYFDIHKEKKIQKNRLAAAQCVVCLELVK